MAKILHATHVGIRAETLLRRPTHRWNVLAAVSGAVYITDQRGELLWISDRVSALHPRAILIPELPLCMPEPGSAVECSAPLLRSVNFALDWQCAAEWSPGCLSERHALAVSDFRQVIECIERVLSDASGGKLVEDHGIRARIDSRLAEASDRLRYISTTRGVLAGLRAVPGIVGLGRGLTPQGDDVLGGYLFTLRALDSARHLSFEIDWELVAAWLDNVGHRTNTISHCLLVDHANGDACAPLVALVHGVLEGKGRARLTQLASEVLRIGASSGQGFLEGVQTAFQVACAPRTAEQKLLAGESHERVGRPARREVARVR